MKRYSQQTTNTGVGKKMHDPTSSPQFLFMKKMIHKPGMFAIALLMVSLFFANNSFAAVKTWNGGTGTGKNWTTAGNWTGGTPVAGDDVVFNTAGTITFSTSPSADVSYNSLTISQGTVTIAGTTRTLTLGGNAGVDFTVALGASLITTNINITLASNATASIAGSYTVSSGRTFNTNGTSVVTTVTGTIISTGTVTCTTGSKLLFNGTSTYQHDVDAVVLPTATWASTSTLNVTGLGLVAVTAQIQTSFAQTFGNVTWNNPSQTQGYSLGGSLTTINGNFTVQSTGSGSLQLANSVSATTTVAGNFSLSTGTLILANSSGTVNLDVKGSFTVASGTLQEGSGTGNVNFAGTTTQTYSKTGGTFSGTMTFTINNNAIVDFGSSSQIDGSGAFTLASGGTLITAHANGITTAATGATGGSIVVTGGRTYTTGGKYVYNGSSAQATGNGLNQNTPNSLTINNSAGVTLTGPTTVSATVTLTSGILTTTATNLLTLTSTSTSAISVGSTTAFVDGPVKWSLGVGTYIFPVGNGSGNYLPYKLVTSAASSPIITVQAFNADAGASATVTSPLTGISHTEYWQAALVSGTFTGVVSLTRQTALSGGLNLIARSTAQSGSYTSIGGTAASPSINNSNAITQTSLGFFVMATDQGNTVSSVSVSATQSASLTYGTAGAVTYTVTITPSGAGSVAGSAALSLTGTALPSGATSSFGSNPVTLPAGSTTPINVTLTINTLGTTPAATTSGITATANAVVSGGSASLVIGTKGLTISGVSGANRTYNGLTNASLTGTAAYVGLANGESFSVTGTPSATFAQANVGTGIAITVTGYTAPSANYTVTQPIGLTGNITTAALTITGLTANAKVYNGLTDVSVTGTAAYGGLQNGETFTVSGSPTFTFATATAGTNKTINQTGSYAAPSSNYTVTQPTLTANINAAPLTITGVTANNKVYNGNANTTTTLSGTASYVGLQNSESFSVTGTPTANFTPNGSVGTGKSVTVTGYTAPNTNYSITQPAGLTADISAANLTVTASAQSKNYGSTAPTSGTLNTNFTVSGLQTGDVANGATLSYSGSPAGNLGTAPVGTYTITASAVTFSSGSVGNYNVNYSNTGTLTVNTKALTITGLTGANKVYNGNTTATFTGTAAYSGLANGETFTVTGTPSATFADKNVGTGKAITVTGYTAPSTNYTVSQPTGLTANITALPVQLSGTKVYDGTTTVAATDLSITNIISPDNLTISGAGTLSSKDFGSRTISVPEATPARVGSPYTNSTTGSSLAVTVNAPVNGNSLVAIISTTGTTTGRISSITQTNVANWTKAVEVAVSGGSTTEIWYASNVSSAGTTVTINAAAFTKYAAIVMEYSGLLTASALDKIASNSGATNGGTTGTTAATTQANELWVGGIGISDDAPTLGTPTNSFTSPTNVAVAGAGNDMRIYALERIVSATGAASSGGTISNNASPWTGAIATFKAASLLTLGGTDAGNYTLTGLSGSMTVTAKNLTETGLTAQNKTYTGTNNATLTGTAALQAAEAPGTGTTSDGKPYTGDAVSVTNTTTGTFASVNVANGIAVTPTGQSLSGAQSTNYSLTLQSLSANITPAGLTITGVTANNKPYDGLTTATLSGTPAYSGLQNGESFSVTGTPVANFTPNGNIGNGKSVTVTGYTAPSGNYSVTQPSLTANITPKGLTISGVTVNLKEYDQTNVANLGGSPVYVGLENGESFSVTGTPVATYDATPITDPIGKKVGSGKAVTVTGYTAPSSNYTVSQPTGLTGDIFARTLIVTATGNNKPYDGNTNATVTLNDNRISGDDLTLTYTAAFATAAAGNNIAVSVDNIAIANGADKNNYLLSETTASTTANIAPVGQTTANYRSKANGPLSAPGTWEYDGGGGGYVPATIKPGIGNNVEIVSPFTVTFDEAFTVGAGKTLKVTGGTANFNGQSVTFKSTAAGTASFGQLGGTLSGESNVTVERFIPNTKRAWRLLSVPTKVSGQTIRQAWQEGNVNPTRNANNLPGFGTIISTGVAAQVIPGGFDTSTASTSIRNYNGSAFVSLTSVNTPIATTGAYFIYIRGDRSITSLTGASTSATTLRTNGTLYKGTQSLITVPANSFTLVGNIYASAINFENIAKSNISNTFYLWDSELGSTGGYETFAGTNSFGAATGGGSWTQDEVDTLIQSGQGFFVSGTATPGSVTLSESSKAYVNLGNNNKGLRPSAQPTISKLSTRLLVGNKIYDGNAVVFNQKYSNDFDADDAIKYANPGENFAIAASGKELAVEARKPVSSEETINFTMKNMKQQVYTLEFKPAHMGTGEAYLVDNYLGTNTAISLTATTKVNFTVTADAKSAATDRFKVVFRPAAVTIEGNPAIKVSPNPVETGIINIRFTQQVKGKYNIKLVDLSGRTVYATSKVHAGGSATQELVLPSGVARGAYHLVITSPDKTSQVQKLFINTNN